MMKPHESQVDDPTHQAIGLLQGKWVFLIVRALLQKPLGFSTLVRMLGVNPATLSARLEQLQDCGLVTTITSLASTHAKYVLTNPGAELSSVLEAIGRWAESRVAQRPCQQTSLIAPATTPDRSHCQVRDARQIATSSERITT